MKKLKKDFQKNINRSRDAPKENSSVDKAKSKLVHSEDYRNKIIKTNEKFKDKIAEKDSKLVQDSGERVKSLDPKKSPQRAKISKKEKLASTTAKIKLVHSKDYKSKIIKSKERYKDKLKKKSSKLVEENNKYSKIDDKQINGDDFVSKQNDSLSDIKESIKKQKYKRKNYKDTVNTRNKDKKTNDNENHKYSLNKNNKENTNKDVKDHVYDKKLRNYQRKQYHLKNELKEYGRFYDAENIALKAGARTSLLTREYLSQGDENAGVESAEKTAGMSSKVLYDTRKYNLNKKKKTLRKASKQENKINKRKSKLEFKSALTDLKNKEEYQKSNAVKKFFKRRRMKSMIAKKHETRFIDRVKKSLLSLDKKAKEIIVKKVRGVLFAIILVFMLIAGMITIGGLGGASLNNSSNSVLTTSYLSDESVLSGINRDFTKLEDDLADQIANIPQDHPGYDQYIYIDTENIGHSIYELFAYITAKCGGPEDPSEVQPDLIDLFNQMYQLEFKEKVEIKTRVVNREYIDEHGRIHTVQEQEPYEYKTLITTLKHKTIGEVAQEVFQGHEDNMLHYNTLMETRGNSGATFGNSELIEANGGVGGGQDYEASSDVQKKIVDACYITPSPGKGWCAMWVSQVYQNAGLGYIGGNACDLYKRYAFTSDTSKLEVGMLVMVESSSSGTEAGLRYGHVGIYIGDGKVIDNIGKVRVTTLDNWIKTFCKNSPVGFGYPPSVQP